jgi:predicted NBD/HSP70 family sugar kinase
MRLPHEHLISQRLRAPLMRSINGIELLNLIRENGPISRASLAKLSFLSKPTVSSQVETLMRQGWVIELGPGESGSKGGKKPTLIRFNADAGRLFGAEIDAAHVRLAVADLEGNIRERLTIPIGPDRSAASVLSIVRRGLARLIDSQPSEGVQRVISIAAPGRVDVRLGVVLDAGNLFNWHGVPVREQIEAEFGLPVFVDNDVKMATLGEIQFGVAKGEQDVVLVRLDTGIGSGIVSCGKLLPGRHWAAGEIAHMVLDLSKASEDWSARGYLESVVGSDRILEEARALGSDATTAIQFLEQARTSKGAAREVFDRVVQHLGIAIANMMCAYDPSLVVLQGGLFACVEEELRSIISNAIPWETRIVFSEIGGEAVLLGTLVAARTQAYDRISRLFDGTSKSSSVEAAVPATSAG